MGNILSLDRIREMLSPVFQSYGVRKATIFGSYAKGTAHENSDVDLLVDSGLKGLRFMSLAAKVEDVLGRNVDIFDTTHIDADSPVDREIKRTGVVFFGK